MLPGPVVSHEERTIEVLALAQIWRRLAKRNQEVLAAYAEHVTPEAVALGGGSGQYHDAVVGGTAAISAVVA
ncbi:hypothetical protein [Nonomuraea sp. KM90]|uniref:hypothetical protein n=1 Tax=Nonomuraea sp. KM90 TaxID=3457428 RepID=UPI003FCE65E8